MLGCRIGRGSRQTDMEWVDATPRFFHIWLFSKIFQIIYAKAWYVMKIGISLILI